MTMLDMPKSEDIKEIIVESPSAWGPYGAKGCSETPAASPPAAIANAVYNAIGVRLRGDHLTPERIIQALADARKSNSGC
jgi:CO/xanthine dehydrogenase Mo-binding subunit